MQQILSAAAALATIDNKQRLWRAEHIEKLTKLGLSDACDAMLFERSIYSDADIARVRKTDSPQVANEAMFCANAQTPDSDGVSRQARWPSKLELSVHYLAPLKSNDEFATFPLSGLKEEATNPRAWLQVQPLMPASLDQHRDEFTSAQLPMRINLIGANDFLQMQADLIRLVYSPQLQKSRTKWLALIVPQFGLNYAPIYAQYRRVPHNARIHIIGDLHSSFASLIGIYKRLHEERAFSSAESFALAPNHFVVFLGDVVDRGDFSLELLFFIGQLLLANPSSVFLLQGNHEECSTYRNFTLLQEVMQKYEQNERGALGFLYFLNYLPTVLFITFDEANESSSSDSISSSGGSGGANSSSPQSARTVQFCHGAVTENEREQTILQKFLDLQQKQQQQQQKKDEKNDNDYDVQKSAPEYALLRYWLNGGDDVCEPSRADTRSDNLKWGDFESTPKERFKIAQKYVDAQTMPPESRKFYSVERLLEEGDIAVNRRRGGGALRAFGSFYVQQYLRKVGVTAVITGHQDQTNFAFLPPAGAKVDPVRFEMDARYGEHNGRLYRPRGYDSVAHQLIGKNRNKAIYSVSMRAGTDFIAVNTSSAYSSRFNESSLKLDCFLTLTQYR